MKGTAMAVPFISRQPQRAQFTVKQPALLPLWASGLVTVTSLEPEAARRCTLIWTSSWLKLTVTF